MAISKERLSTIYSMLFALSALQANRVEAQLGCDADLVSLDMQGTIITVNPEGSDDTANIQCALDEAVDRGIPTVKLAEGDFFAAAIHVVDFEGSLEGQSKAKTRIVPLSESVDCEGQIDSGQRTAWWKFVGGAVAVRTLTIDSQEVGGLCQDGSDTLHLMHFTGRTDVDDCASDVIQSAVDRVDILDDLSSGESYSHAVAASAEEQFGGCYDTLLGGFKVNRSTFKGMHTGLFLSMRGSAQVDINFNTFEPFEWAITKSLANQSTTVLRNEFLLNETADDSDPMEVDGNLPGAVRVLNGPIGPAENRISIENNRFTVGSRPFESSTTTIFVSNPEGFTNINFSARKNRFEYTLTPSVPMSNLRAINLQGVSNATIAGNKFAGDSQGIFLFGSNPAFAAGNAVTGNMFNLAPDQLGIFLANDSKENTVGPGQNAGISDFGNDNFVSFEGNFDP